MVSCVVEHKESLNPNGLKMAGNLQIKKVFDHECGCCMYNGILRKNGELFNAAKRPSKYKLSHEDDGINSFNISCNKGILYKVQPFQQNQTVQNQNDNTISDSNDKLDSLDISYVEIDVDKNGKIESDKSQGISII